jgi:hypothetical protein
VEVARIAGGLGTTAGKKGQGIFQGIAWDKDIDRKLEQYISEC